MGSSGTQCGPEEVAVEGPSRRDFLTTSAGLGAGVLAGLAGTAEAMGPDQIYIHCTRFSDETFRKIAGSGGHVSIATAIEMAMRHGMPPTQQALAHGILPSLSTDVETTMAADMFTVMRATFTLQRALLNERYIASEENLPQLVSCHQVLQMATVAGARAAHVDGKVGTLTPGKEADVIMLDANRINTMPLNQRARHRGDDDGHQQRAQRVHRGSAAQMEP